MREREVSCIRKASIKKKKKVKAKHNKRVALRSFLEGNLSMEEMPRIES